VIPPFNPDGCLPPGIYRCTLAEAGARFGTFQGSDRRPRLWARLVEFIREASMSGAVEMVLLDGSFVTSQPDPNDIDLVLVLPASHDFLADLPAAQYDILAQKRVRKRFGFDILVVKNGSESLEQAVTFFQQVRQRPGVRKGLLEILL
jgi:hypothetical protein